MNTRLLISLPVILALTGCAHRARVAVDVTAATNDQLQKHVGNIVSVRGRFSLRGKTAPFVQVGDHPIYLVSRGPFSWGEPYASMEGREVRVTGTLRFAHSPQPAADALPEGRASDHFYFDAENAKVELSPM